VSNVYRLYNALENEAGNNDHDQLAFYASGVGTEGGLMARVLGGAVGTGLAGNIKGAYQWLTTKYQSGDRIALFGFSRGAYTARSLGGMVADCGLIDTIRLDEQQIGRQIERLYLMRYGQNHDASDRRWRDGPTFAYDPDDAKRIPVDFIGVWETVGSLGIPDNMTWFDPLNPSAAHTFPDVKLNPHVVHARHALAMDERRRPFNPTLWSNPAPGQDVKQVWFPGSHLDVGGCHPERGLGDRTLQWMIDEAQEAIQLRFHQEAHKQIHPDPLDVLHDDNRGLLDPALAPWLEPVLATVMAPVMDVRPRAVPLVDCHGPQAELDQSVYERQQEVPISSGPYRPTRVLEPGQSATVDVFAHEPWNETGLYLRAGRYTFVAEGEWLAGDSWFGPEGATGVSLTSIAGLARIVGTAFVDLGERIYRWATGRKSGACPVARRAIDLPWMSLVGVIANDFIAVNGKRAHERFHIGRHQDHRVMKDGYFYAFANNTWSGYGNNHGGVRLTVTRAT